MFDELRKLVKEENKESFESTITEILNSQKENQEVINGNIVNEWMYKSLVNACIFGNFFKIVGNNFAKGMHE